VAQDSSRQSVIRDFEREAEVLVVHHLDLLAQMEAQLRAVHNTMRRIYGMRAREFREGPELTNGQRASTLTDLSIEMAAIDRNLQEEHECCGDMQQTINQMQAHLTRLKQLARHVGVQTGASTPRGDGGAPDAGGSAAG
jgi:uncharacterized coiled-coil protein SlyX